MSKGIIYVCSTNVDGLLKIGRTKDFDERMRKLESDGYANANCLKREFAIEVDNHEEVEELLHTIFAHCRAGKAELFAVDLNIVKQLLTSLQGRKIYPKNETKQEVFEAATEIVQSRTIPDGLYSYETRVRELEEKLYAKMKIEDGKFKLLAGSSIATYKQLNSPSWVALRKKIKVKDGVLVEDVECSSPSMAASFVAGHPKNGWTSWKNVNNEYIDIYRQRNVDNED